MASLLSPWATAAAGNSSSATIKEEEGNDKEPESFEEDRSIDDCLISAFEKIAVTANRSDHDEGTLQMHLIEQSVMVAAYLEVT